MTPSETRAIVTLGLLAAFVDGEKHDREREEIKRIAQGLAGDDGLHLPTLYQDVLLKRVSLASLAGELRSAQARQLAYEMAVCVCDADGAQSPAEQRFLQEAQAALGLAAPAAAAFTQAAEALSTVPLDEGARFDAGPTGHHAGDVAPARPAGAAPAGSSTPATAAPAATRPVPDAAELDRTVLNAAILNGALELLPETLSTLAIIPLQMKLVYRIGQAHGYELDRGHVKDFLATAGVGLTSQYLEQAGRKLLGGLLGRMGGGLGRTLGQQAVSSGMSFATTWALGHLARRYYAGGREFSTQMLKDTYAGLVQEGRELQLRYAPAIQDKARTLDAGKVLAMVRGS